jgi:Endonuclease/Exonuclease/phosphatase family
MITTCRVMTLNCRTSSAIEMRPSRWWSRRKPYLIDFIKKWAPSVIGTQECTKTQAADITNALGPNWTWYSVSNVKIIWDSAKWTAIDNFYTELPYTNLGMTGHRPVTMVRLQSIKTGEACWFVDHHSAVHITNDAEWRKKHMAQICDLIAERSEHDRVIFFGDFNDLPHNSGVRGVAATHGYRHLRARLPHSKITGEMWNTFNGFKVTKREGKWIDDILASSAITPLNAAVGLTDPSVYPVAASDHNGVFARMRFGAAV